MPKRPKSLKGKSKKHTLKSKLVYGIIAVTLIVGCFFIFSSFYSSEPSSDSPTALPKAALIDHLGFSSPPPNKTFNNLCKTILENASFSYTYHEGREVTVDFYRKLPTYGYSLVILRVHSAVIKQEGGNRTNLIGLFTSEMFNETTRSMYYDDLLNSRLALATLLYGSNDTYFGITPFFVEHPIRGMKGYFKDTVIIMMGCEGLNETSMADALVRLRKAKVYISWTGPVSISHTDHSTIRLLRSLLQENQTISDAVLGISRDPTWLWSRLNYYPDEGVEDVGNYRIQDLINGLTTKASETNIISLGLWHLEVKLLPKPSRTKRSPRFRLLLQQLDARSLST